MHMCASMLISGPQRLQCGCGTFEFPLDGHTPSPSKGQVTLTVKREGNLCLSWSLGPETVV